MRRTLVIVASAALAFTAAGCGSDSSKLERRVAELEAQNAELRSAQRDLRLQVDVLDSALSLRLKKLDSALSVRLKKLDDRTWANDKALWTGVVKAQYDIQCGPSPELNCHVAAAFPGSVYTSGTPRRLFVTPWP